MGQFGPSDVGETDRQLFVLGNYPTIAEELIITGEADFKRGDVVVVDTDGTVELCSKDNIGSAARGGIICDDVTAADGETVASTMYVKGAFAKRALTFAEGTTADDVKGTMTAYGMLIQETRV
jgi:hypothetical protein